MKTLEGQSGDEAAEFRQEDPPHPSYLFMITVVTIQLVKVRGTL